MKPSRIGSPADRLYRLLLLAFPKDVRQRDGEEMARLFADQWRHARGLREGSSLWLLAVGDALRYGLGDRIAPRKRLPAVRRPNGFAPVSDLRYAWRVHSRAPVTGALALLTIAIGIGATTVVISFTHAVVARPLGVADPDDLITLYHVGEGTGSDYSSFSYPDYIDFRDQNSVLSDLAAWSTISLAVDAVTCPVSSDQSLLENSAHWAPY